VARTSHTRPDIRRLLKGLEIIKLGEEQRESDLSEKYWKQHGKKRIERIFTIIAPSLPTEKRHTGP